MGQRPPFLLFELSNDNRSASKSRAVTFPPVPLIMSIMVSRFGSVSPFKVRVIVDVDKPTCRPKARALRPFVSSQSDRSIMPFHSPYIAPHATSMQAKFAPRFMEPALHLVQCMPVANANKQPSLILRDLRHPGGRKRFTLEQVAEAVDISREHLSKIERDEADVSLALLRKLADFFKVQPHELFRSAQGLSDDEQELVSEYRNLTPLHREAIHGLAKSLKTPGAA